MVIDNATTVKREGNAAEPAAGERPEPMGRTQRTGCPQKVSASPTFQAPSSL